MYYFSLSLSLIRYHFVFSLMIWLIILSNSITLLYRTSNYVKPSTVLLVLGPYWKQNKIVIILFTSVPRTLQDDRSGCGRTIFLFSWIMRIVYKSRVALQAEPYIMTIARTPAGGAATDGSQVQTATGRGSWKHPKKKIKRLERTLEERERLLQSHDSQCSYV